MKRIEIRTLNDFFNGLKLNGFSRETRSAIIKNHVKMNKIVKETDELAKEIYNRLVNDNLEAIQKLNEKREIYKLSPESEKKDILLNIVNDCRDGLKVESELNTLIKELGEENVEIELIKFEKEAFIGECLDAGLDLTLADFGNIDILFN